MQKLAPGVVAIATSIEGFLLFSGTIFGVVVGAVYAKDIKSFFARVWKSARRGLAFLFSVPLSVIIAVSLVFVSIPLTQASVVSSTGKLLPPPIATLETTMHPLLKQKVPNCNNPQGVSWFVHKGSTYVSCSGSSLLMQDILPGIAADMELAQVHYATYNQTRFHVQVQVIFQNPTDPQTFAALLVQTPAQLNVPGGFILALNSKGEWQLQEVVTGKYLPIRRFGEVDIDPSKPVTIAVDVNNGLLVGFVNGQQVVSYNDTLNPLPGRVDLEVQGTSSQIFFLNFELDV